MRGRSRGNILLVLVVGALAATLAAVVAGITLNQLSLSTQMEALNRYENAADSVVSLALVELQDDPEFGQSSHPDYSRLFRWTGPSGEVGLLTFDPAIAASEGIEVSINNVEGSSSVDAGHRRVPRGMVLLRGSGNWGESSGQMECLVHRPPYPYAISATGTVQVLGTATIGQLPHGTDGNNFSVGDLSAGEELLPAHVKASSDVNLNGNVLIQGDVTSGGLVTLGGAADVRGDIVNGAGPVSVQRIDVTTLDHPPGSFEIVPSNYLTNTTLVGRHRYSGVGGLLVDGELSLQDAVLFVDGDLTIRNGLRGNGAVIATGQISVQGDTQVTGLDKAALVAEGGVLFQGTGSSQFQGTVYSNGDILARQLTVAGAIIGGGTASQVVLDNAILAHADGDIDLSIKKNGFHRSAVPNATGYPAVSDFGPQNYSYLEEAEMIGPNRVRLRRISYHPRVGTQELGLGEIDLTAGTFIPGTGDLGETIRGRGPQSVINVLNTQNSTNGTFLEPAGWQIRTSPLQVLHYINFYNSYPADDFTWIQDRFPPNRAHSAHEFKFRPSQVLTPGERMKILLRRRRR